MRSPPGPTWSTWPAGTWLILREECRIRRPAEVHRLRRAPHHRVSHRHRPRRHTGSARRAGTASSQHARVEDRILRSRSHRPAQPILQRVRRQRCVARNRHRRNRSDPLGSSSSASPITPTWHAARSPPTATGCCTSPPHHPRRPTIRLRIDATRRWAKRSPPPGPASAPRPPTPKPPDSTRPKTTGLESLPTERHRTIRHTHLPQLHHQPARTRFTRPPERRMQNRQLTMPVTSANE